MNALRNAFRASKSIVQSRVLVCIVQRNNRSLERAFLPSRSQLLAAATLSNHSKWRPPCEIRGKELRNFSTFVADLPSAEQLDNDRRTVLVGSLSSTTTETNLAEYFSVIGEVEDTRIIRTLSGKSKGFAFVRFKDRETTGRIIGTENIINDRSVSVEKLDVFRSVYLQNIPSSMGEDQIREYFSKFGNIERVKIPGNVKTKERKGYCLITFDSEIEACEVVKRRSHLINGFEVLAEFKMNLKQPRKLHIKNLSYDTTIEDLKIHFSAYTGLKEIDLAILPERNQCEAFLTFNSEKTVEEILQQGEIHFGGNSVKGERVSEKFSRRARHKSAFIGDLPITITKAEVIRYFSRFGGVKSVSLVKTGGNAQFGIVKFKHIGGLRAAMQQGLHVIDMKHYTLRQLGLTIHEGNYTVQALELD